MGQAPSTGELARRDDLWPVARGHRTLAEVLLVFALFTLTACGSTPSPSPSAAPTESASASATTVLTGSPTDTGTPSFSSLPSTPPSPAVAGGWSAVTRQAAVDGVQLYDVVWTGSQFVATGSALDDSTAFVDSVDGQTWRRWSGGSPAGSSLHLAAGSAGVLAVGTIYAGSGVDHDRPASWFSPDGQTWTVSVDPFPAGRTGSDRVTVTDVVATDSGWLAVGRQDPLCNANCGTTPVRALAWTSKDGLSWRRVTGQGAFEGGAINAVGRTGSGFVAGGMTNDNAAGHAAFWTSPDGRAWTRVPDARLFRAAKRKLWTEVKDITVDHGTVVAVGMGSEDASDFAIRAWLSMDDGHSWALAEGDWRRSGPGLAVAGTPEGFLAIGPGSDQAGCGDGVWDSVDGRSWSCLALGQDAQHFGPYAAAASSSTEVLVGLMGGGEPSPAGLPGGVLRRPVP